MRSPTFSRLSAAITAAMLSAAVVHASNLDSKLFDASYRLIAADFDGDQKADLLWQGNANQQHELKRSTSVPIQRWQDGFLGLDWNHATVNLIVGDFNGDAANDVLLQSKSPGLISQVMLAEFDGTFGVPVQSIGDYHQGLRWDGEHHRLIVGDFDGDMRDDIFLQGTENLHRHGISLASAEGTFDSIAFDFDNAHLSQTWGLAQIHIVAGDFDGNGAAELLLQPRSSGSLSVIQTGQNLLDTLAYNFGTNHLGEAWSESDSQLLVGDFNGDGKDDVFLLAKKAGKLSALIPSDGQGFPAVALRVNIANVDSIRQVLIADFNADGIDDILLVYQDGSIATVLANDGKLIELTAALRDLGLLGQEASLQNIAESTSALSTSAQLSTFSALPGGTTPISGVQPTPIGSEPQNLATLQSPQFPNAVGKLEGQAGVSGGAASYHIPIAIPPGRLGMQPGVSLNYSSRAGNGIAGMGWSLSAGQSSIHRCPATVAQDGYAVGVRLGSEDRLCLNGQRLVNTSGAYGATGTVYRTETESFVRVTQTGALHAASSSFVVEYASGKKGYFNQSVVTAGVTAPTSWLLKRLEDVHGNSIHFNYEAIVNGEVLISSVQYTGTGATPGSRRVIFSYETRPDYRVDYLARGKTVQSKRLKHITTYTGSTETDKVRQYTLFYLDRAPSVDNTNRSLLNYVQECAFNTAGTHCLQATEFSWARQQSQAQGILSLSLGDVTQKSVNVGSDFDGDGRNEIVVQDWQPVVTTQSTPQADLYFLDENFAPQSNRTIHLEHRVGHGLAPLHEPVDIDRDGRLDWLGRGTNNEEAWYTFTSDASGNTGIEAAVNSSSFPAINYSLGYMRREWADINGDGFVDVVTNGQCAGRTTERCIRVHVHNKDRNNPVWTSSNDIVALRRSYYENNLELESFSVSDLNGDGLGDLVLTYTRQIDRNTFTSSIRVMFATRMNGVFGYVDGVKTPSQLGLPDPLPDQYLLADVNGDGLADFVSAEYEGAAKRWFVRLNTGGVFGTKINTGSEASLEVRNSKLQAKYGAAILVDHDGDGAQDIMVPVQRVVQGCVDMLAFPDPNGDEQELYKCDDELYSDAHNASAANFLPGGMSLAHFDIGLYSWQVLRFHFNGSGATIESMPLSLYTHLPSSAAGGPTQTDLNADGQTEYLWHHRQDLSVNWGPNYQNFIGGRQGNTVPGVNIDMRQGPRVEQFSRGTELLMSVTDGFEQQSSWQYTTLANGTSEGPQPFYSVPFADADRDTAADGQHFYFTSTMPAVSKFTQSNGQGGNWISRYGYREAIYNAAGRGMQGFKQIIEESSKNLRTTTTFEQKFPIAGQVANIVVERLSDNQTISTTTNTIKWRGPSVALPATPPDSRITGMHDGQPGPISNHTYLPYVETSVTQTQDLKGLSLGTTTTTIELDGFGNVDKTTTTKSDSHVTETTIIDTTFQPNQMAWWLDKSTVSSTRKCLAASCVGNSPQNNNDKEVSTSVTAWFDETRRLPGTVVTGHPSDAAQQLSTTYSYDSYGNVISTSVSGGSGDTALAVRTTSSSYSAYQGYFPGTVTDAMGGVTSMSYSLAHGQVETSEDPLNNVVLLEYDAFGRVVSKQLSGAIRTRTAVTSTYSESVSGVTHAKYKITTAQPGVSPTTVTWFDAFGRTLRTETNDPIFGEARKYRVITEYDEFGRVTRQSVPHLSSTTPGTSDYTRYGNYDVLDRPASRTLPNDSSGLTITYDYNGNATTVEVGTGLSGAYSVSRTRNILGQWWIVTDQGSESVYGNGETVTTTFRYDAFGNPITITRKPLGGADITNTAVYNTLGHKISMTDPDRGQWFFTYNVAGELVKQQDANGNRTWFTYDNLGRTTQRFEAPNTDVRPQNAVAYWTFATNCVTGMVPTATLLCGSGKSNEIAKTYTYDREGLLAQTDFEISPPGEATKLYTIGQQYDNEGRPTQFTAPGAAGVVTTIDYNSQGFAEKLKLVNEIAGVAAGTALQDINGIDAFGNVTAEQYSNNLHATRQYSSQTGRILGICLNASANCTLNNASNKQSLNYGAVAFSNGATRGYDDFGNLVYQENLVQSVIENFVYDRRQRLVQSYRKAEIGGGFPALEKTVAYRYDALGNLIKKADHAAVLQYGSVVQKAPHQVGKTWADEAMTQLIAEYVYDLNGNLTSSTGANGRSLSYNHQQVPVTINRGLDSSVFRYDENNDRYFEKHVENGKITRIWKIGKLFEYSETSEGGITNAEEKHYVTSVAQLSYKPQQNGKAACSQWRYFHGDRLGSIETITGQNGQVLERRGFDPFGKPLSGNWMFDNTLDGTTATAKGLFSTVTTRGFTGHDHIDSVGLIHMNGRSYDPDLGRFMGVDPFMQAPLNSQSLNPYSYIMNNPLAGTDPTGYLTCDVEQSAATCGMEAGQTAEITKDGKVIGTATMSEDGNSITTLSSESGLESTLSVKGNSIISINKSGDLTERTEINIADKPSGKKTDSKNQADERSSSGVSAEDILSDPEGFIAGLQVLEDGFSSNKEVDEAAARVNASAAKSNDDVSSSKEERDFVNSINKKIFKALDRFNRRREEKVELFLTAARGADGNFYVTFAALAPQGASFLVPRGSDLVAHWHHSELERMPSKGDHSPVKGAGIPNFTITYDRKGGCCNVYEVGRHGKEFVYRTISTDSSFGDWRTREEWR